MEIAAVAATAALVTGTAYVYYWSNGAVLLAGDGLSRLNIARRVVNSLDPGFAQLGAIWPPAPQVVMLPLVWVNPLYRSGIAGSVPAMLAFVAAATYAYLLAKRLTGSRVGGVIAFLIVLLNPNALYLATTPMSEPLLWLTVLASAYHLLSWMRSERLIHLVVAALWVFIGSMTRYEGWSLVLGGGIIVTIYALARYRSRRRTETLVLMYLVPAGYGILLWLLYGAIIFGSPLYFATGTGSAKSDAQAAAAHQHLGTYFNLLGTFRTVGGDVIDVIGLPLLAIAALALALAVISWVRPRHRDVSGALTVAFLMLPGLFLMASLFLGQEGIFAAHTPVEGLWNTRYGLNLLPAVAILCAYPVRFNRHLTLASLVAIVAVIGISSAMRGPLLRDTRILSATGNSKVQAWSAANFPMMSGLQPLVLLDAVGSSRADAATNDAAKWMQEHYTGGLVLTSALGNDPFIFRSRLPSDAFITEGMKPYWNDEMRAPWTWATWIVLQPQGYRDKIGLELRPRIKTSGRFRLVFNNDQYEIYERHGQPGEALTPSCADARLNQLTFAANPTVSGRAPYVAELALANGADRPVDGVIVGLSIAQGAQYVSRIDFGNGQPWLVDGSRGATLYRVAGIDVHRTEHISLRITPSAAWYAAGPDAPVHIEARIIDVACRSYRGSATTIVVPRRNSPGSACISPEPPDLKFAGDQTLSGSGPFDIEVEFTNGGAHSTGGVLLGFTVTQGSRYVSRVDFGNGQPWLVNGSPGATLYRVEDVASGRTARITLRVTPSAAWAGSAPDAEVIIESRFVDGACPGASSVDEMITLTH